MLANSGFRPPSGVVAHDEHPRVSFRVAASLLVLSHRRLLIPLIADRRQRMAKKNELHHVAPVPAEVVPAEVAHVEARFLPHFLACAL